MVLVIDEHVPESVAAFFRGRGDAVIYAREALLPGAEDATIAKLADEKHGLVLTCDHDFDALISRAPKGNKLRFRYAGRLSLHCKPRTFVDRLERFMPVIDAEAHQAASRPDPRVIIELGNNFLRIVA
jgi:hypothetical protein